MFCRHKKEEINWYFEPSMTQTYFCPLHCTQHQHTDIKVIITWKHMQKSFYEACSFESYLKQSTIITIFLKSILKYFLIFKVYFQESNLKNSSSIAHMPINSIYFPLNHCIQPLLNPNLGNLPKLEKIFFDTVQTQDSSVLITSLQAFHRRCCKHWCR